MREQKIEKATLVTIPVLAQLLEKEILGEPRTQDPVVRAICASLAEWLARKAKMEPPSWAIDTGPSSRAVFFVPPEAKPIVHRAVVLSPTDFRKRLIFVAALADTELNL